MIETHDRSHLDQSKGQDNMESISINNKKYYSNIRLFSNKRHHVDIERYSTEKEYLPDVTVNLNDYERDRSFNAYPYVYKNLNMDNINKMNRYRTIKNMDFNMNIMSLGN